MRILVGIVLLGCICIVVVAAMLFAIAQIGATRGRHGSSGALARAALEVGAMVDPGKRHVVEAVDKEAGIAEDDDEGAPPTAGVRRA